MNYESELGIPAQIAYLQDVIFEHLPIEQARTFPERFLEAVPVGGDLYPAFWKFMLFLLLDDVNGLNRFEENKERLRLVADFYERAVDDEEISMDEYTLGRYELPVFLTARNIIDGLNPANSVSVMEVRTALYTLGALEHDAAVNASNYWDTEMGWAVLEERDEEHFRNGVAIAWSDKLLEYLSQARVTRTPAEAPPAVAAIALEI
jgi:hypothetical protein